MGKIKEKKWIEDLNVRLETIKLLEIKIGRTPFDMSKQDLF